jgi:hypothetical protein
MLAWLKNLYQNNLTFRAIVQAVEGGLIVGFLTATANGIDFSKKGLVALGSAVVGGIITAIRNYFLNRPGQPEILTPPASVAK